MFPPLPSRAWCQCLGVLPLSAAWRDLWDELRELVNVSSRAEWVDEVSDVAFGVGRLLGAVCRRVYVRVPFARSHIEKVTARQDGHGCVRSARHLVGGVCPSMLR